MKIRRFLSVVTLILVTSFNAYADTTLLTPFQFLNLVNRPKIDDSACVVPNQQSVLECGYQCQELILSDDHSQNVPNVDHARADTTLLTPSQFLNLVNRPKIDDSACVVPNQQSVLECGYQCQELILSDGHSQNVPNVDHARADTTLLTPSQFLNLVNRPKIGDSACVLPNQQSVLEWGDPYQERMYSDGHSQNILNADHARAELTPSQFLNLVNRPKIGDSACVVPNHQVVLELGYQYQELMYSEGHSQSFPNAEFRLGLPGLYEFILQLPNFINQSMSPNTGFAATALGIKHEIAAIHNWIVSVEGFLTLPTGNNAFGSRGYGFAVNGIANYYFNPKLNLAFILGASSETTSRLNSGGRYTSINPDIIVTYAASQRVNLYAEVYGQTKTNPRDGMALSMDAGIVFLILPTTSVDLEIGQRIRGNISGIEHYIGTGMTVML